MCWSMFDVLLLLPTRTHPKTVAAAALFVRQAETAGGASLSEYFSAVAGVCCACDTAVAVLVH